MQRLIMIFRGFVLRSDSTEIGAEVVHCLHYFDSIFQLQRKIQTLLMAIYGIGETGTLALA